MLKGNLMSDFPEIRNLRPLAWHRPFPTPVERPSRLEVWLIAGIFAFGVAAELAFWVAAWVVR